MALFVKGIAHLGLKVSDIQKSSQFYQSIGFQVSESFSKQADIGEVKVQFLRSNVLTIELYQLPNTSANSENGCGIEHIAFEVSDLNETLDAIHALGYPIHEGPVHEKRDNYEVRFFLIEGLDGERVEFDMTTYFNQ